MNMRNLALPETTTLQKIYQIFRIEVKQKKTTPLVFPSCYY